MHTKRNIYRNQDRQSEQLACLADPCGKNIQKIFNELQVEAKQSPIQFYVTSESITESRVPGLQPTIGVHGQWARKELLKELPIGLMRQYKENTLLDKFLFGKLCFQKMSTKKSLLKSATMQILNCWFQFQRGLLRKDKGSIRHIHAGSDRWICVHFK